MSLPTNVDEFLREARERYEFGKESDKADRTIAEDDNKFAYADDTDLGQWDKAAKKARKKRPTVQWNRIPTYVQQVANDGRQNKPSIRIAPEDGATPETAEYFQARIRHIEYESNADIAKDTARDQQITTGRGFLRVRTEWIPGTQRQRIKIDRIENQFSVVWDPAAREYDRRDAEWCFVVSHISRAEHIRRFGKKSLVAHMDFTRVDSELENWVGVGDHGEMIQVAEYWVKEWESQTVPASDGQPERVEQVAKVCQYVIDGAQIHSDTEWLGSTIPIPPQWGKEAIVEGRRRTFSLIRNAKEPQRGLNLALSNLHEQTSQQTKTPWMVAAGSIAANHENDWANIHVTPLGYLIYQAHDAGGRPLPPPTRNTWEPPIQALVEQVNLCIDGIKAAMGIFDAAMGAQSNETSGIAIERRKKESDVSNYHFPDNESRTNKYLGEILVELIKKLDRPGTRNPIRTEDGKTHVVPVGIEHNDWKTGEPVTHDLMSGQYGVSVSSGPSYTSQRQEAYDRDAALIQAQPDLIWVIGDQLFANDDTAGAEERADRLKRAIAMKTPGLIQEKGQQGPDPQAMQQQLQQMHQQLQQTQAFAQHLHEQLTTEAVKSTLQIKLKQMDLAFQREKLQVDDQNAKLKVASTEGIAELEQQISVLMHAHELQQQEKLQQQQQAAAQVAQASDQAHASDTQASDQEHQADQSAQARQAAADSQQQAQEHQAQQSDADRQAAAAQQQNQGTEE